MPFSLGISDGRISVGEDKRITFTPLDADGNPTVASAVDLVLESAKGATIEKDLSDFSQNGTQYEVTVRFTDTGPWAVELEVTGSGSGAVEKVTREKIYVKP